MACKKAVVSTDVGGVGEALEECGVLLRSRPPHDLADAIVKLLMDKRLRDEFRLILQSELFRCLPWKNQ